MPNMTYCQFENTLRAMRQVQATMEEADTLEDLRLNEYERDAYEQMRDLFLVMKTQMDRLDETA